jgi:hypothetical protein
MGSNIGLLRFNDGAVKIPEELGTAHSRDDMCFPQEKVLSCEFL